MDPASEAAITALVREAEAAHGAYETTTLRGVRDEDWPGWYAAYMIAHGFPEADARATAFDVRRLAALLRALDADFQAEQPAGEWQAYYGRRIAAALA